MTSLNDKTPELITIEAADGPKEFLGKVLVEVTTEKPYSPRWTEMKLCQKFDDDMQPTGYVLYSLGRSVVYHDVHGDCHKGVRTLVSDLISDAEPCQEPGCQPEDFHLLPGDSYVRMEEDRPKFFVCRTAGDVVARLRFNGGNISGIGQQLLREAAVIDTEFAAIFNRVERI